MAAKSTRGGSRSTAADRKQVEGYWEVLDPTGEYQYSPGEEIRAFDDRADRGQRNPGIKVQFCTESRGRRKVATFSFEDTSGLDELIEDLSDLRRNLA